MRYKRARIDGGTYFITIVTFKRIEILSYQKNIPLLREAFRYVKKNHPFSIDAIVVLPDHIHCMLTLPNVDKDYPKRIRLIKTNFSRNCSGIGIRTTASRIAKAEKAIWQRRYWEHTIRDDEDFRRHVEYIHYNPVEHGFVTSPIEWKYSSFHSYVRKSLYRSDWWRELIHFDQGIGTE